jgi:flagellar motor protein MotB
MIQELVSDPTMALLTKSLQGASARQEALAAACGDGEAAPQEVRARVEGLEFAVEEDLLRPAGPDGNNVDLASEMGELAQNALRFDSSATVLSLKGRLEERGLVISVTSDGLLFARGSAELRAEAVGVLESVGGMIRKLDSEMLVEGHTCDLPISTPVHPSNWELSTARATTVLRFLVEHAGVKPWRIGAAGYAETRPCAPNDSETHRRLNRRVNLVVLSGAMTIVHQAQTPPSAAPPHSRSE